MGFFDRHKALIITTLSMSILLLLLYNISIQPSSKNFAEMMVDLEHLELEDQQQESPEEERPAESQQTSASSVRTHQAFNQQQEAREQNFEQRLNEIFERNSAQQEANEVDDTPAEDGQYSLNNNSRPQQERSDGDNTSSELSQQTGTMRNSSISYSLVGRAAIVIPNPVYTCDAAGKIVINITVNSRGQVIKTTVNKSSSTSSNQCLEERALEYASQARFSRVPGRASQIGTITYQFQG